MGWIEENAKVWRASPQYARAQALLADYRERTDLKRVVIRCGNDITLAEQDAEVGYDGSEFFVEVTGTVGVRVGHVFERYCGICHLIWPDFAVSVPWSLISDERNDFYIPGAQIPHRIPEQKYRIAAADGNER